VADLSSATAFFLALGGSTSANGVLVQGLTLSTDAPQALPTPPCPFGEQRRLALPAALSAAVLPAGAGADRADCAGGRDQERRRVAWAYLGGSRAGRARTGREERLSVSIRPARVVVLPHVGGDLRRVCQLLVGGIRVFLTGPPGCAKSHLVNEAVELMRDAGLSVAACASTGVTATLVSGTTVHSWAGFCNGDADVKSPLQTVLNEVIPFAAKARMCASMVLVIDEVGALSSDFMTRLDEALRAVRRRSSPFGGLTLLTAGAFLQLSPLRGSYAFLSDAWQDALANRAVVLKAHWRHMQDTRLLSLLLRLRKGRHTAADMVLLATRSTAVAPPGVICLFCHKADADAKNEEELLGLAGESVMLTAVDKAHAKYLPLALATTLRNSAVKLLPVLTLRLDAEVAVPTSCLAGQGVPCGSRGVVTSFRAVGNRRYPRVRFQLPSRGDKTLDVIPSLVHTVALDGATWSSTRSQVPLMLAWASTIHAAQGWTLQEATVDLTFAFATGQALSGLSRTPALERLHIIGFDEDRIIVDGTALAFHESLADF